MCFGTWDTTCTSRVARTMVSLTLNTWTPCERGWQLVFGEPYVWGSRHSSRCQRSRERHAGDQIAFTSHRRSCDGRGVFEKVKVVRRKSQCRDRNLTTRACFFFVRCAILHGRPRQFFAFPPTFFWMYAEQ